MSKIEENKRIARRWIGLISEQMSSRKTTRLLSAPRTPAFRKVFSVFPVAAVSRSFPRLSFCGSRAGKFSKHGAMPMISDEFSSSADELRSSDEYGRKIIYFQCKGRFRKASPFFLFHKSFRKLSPGLQENLKILPLIKGFNSVSRQVSLSTIK
jgi:hypothetical protein